MKSLKRNYTILISFMLLFYFANGIFCNIISVYLSGAGHSSENAAAIISAASLFAMIIMPVMGYVADRAKRLWSVLLVAVAVSAGAALLFGRASGFWPMFLLNGIAVSFSELLLNLCERISSQTPFKYGKIRIWGTIGYAMGTQAAGIVYDMIAPAAVYSVAAGAMILGLLLYPMVSGSISHTQAQRRDSVGLRVLNSRPFWAFLILTFLYRGLSYVSVTYQPILFTSLGLTVAGAETILSVAVLAEIPMIFLAGWLTNRFSTRKVMLIACIGGVFVDWFLVGALHEAALLAVAAVLRNAFNVIFIVLTLKVTLELFGAGGNLAMGLAGTAKCLGRLLFQNASGQVLGNFDVQMLYTMLAVFSLVEIPLCLLYRPKHVEDVRL